MRNKCLYALSLLLFVQFSSAPLHGQGVKALGKYDFQHYYEYAELTSYMNDLNKAFPQLTELRTLVKSPMGRDVWMLVINNPKTGKPEEKPAFFANQIHAGEVIAAASGVYTIWHILDNYGKNPEITRLVDNLAMYFVPRLDVDGAEAYLTGKPAGKDPKPVDSDGDLLFDEDPPDDVDGDGFVVQMRKKDPKGQWKLSSEDPRIMVRRMLDEVQGDFYTMYSEGTDNDGDGKYNEDDFSRGFLSNRNYPGNWQPDVVQGGGKLFPMEEVVTRAEVDFLANTPNLAIYLQHHCCGRLILRPPTTTLDKDFKNLNDLEVFKVATARALERSGWNLGTSVFEWDQGDTAAMNRKSSQVWRDKDGKLRNTPAGMYPEIEGQNPAALDFSNPMNWDHSDVGYFAWGSSLETAYNIFGLFALADEHWREPDYNWDGLVSEKERLKWNDTDMGGKVFVNWHAFKHPTLGDVEIGGWKRSKVSPPEGALVEKECEMGNRYTIYLAGLFPKVQLKAGDVTAVDKKLGVYKVDLSVENIGALRTATEHAEYLKVVKPVRLEVEPDANLEIVYGEKRVELGQIKGGSESVKNGYVLRVKDPSKKASLKVSVWSQRAGRDSKEIVIAVPTT